jgi:hypothetical protein
VDLNRNICVRGSGAIEPGSFPNGFATTNSFFWSEGVYAIPETAEQIAVLTGLFGSDRGMALIKAPCQNSLVSLNHEPEARWFLFSPRFRIWFFRLLAMRGAILCAPSNSVRSELYFK